MLEPCPLPMALASLLEWGGCSSAHAAYASGGEWLGERQRNGSCSIAQAAIACRTESTVATNVPAMKRIALVTGVALLAACAADLKPLPAAVSGLDCVRITGSNVCRKTGSLGSDNTTIISGEAVRKAGGSITTPEATKVD